MANRKISDLTALTTPATGDLLLIVDISEAAAAAKNKKITFGELFASIPAGTAAAPSIAFEGDSNTGIYSPSADTIAIVVNGAEATRISSNGQILVGVTSTTGIATGSSANQGLYFSTGSSLSQVNDNANNYWSKATGYTSGDYTAHWVNNTYVGGITTNGNTTSYVTASDYRLKENVVPLIGAIDRINDLQVYRFNFITHPDHTVDGFIAHEAQLVVPECVTKTKDAVDEDGKPVMQGMDQSKLVPLLTAALQEAIAKIEALETRLSALEAA
jgi:hypothetical protein